MTGSDGLDSVQAETYIVRIGRQCTGSGISVYLPISMYNLETMFLIDTGAEVTIISNKLFERIPDKYRPKLLETVVSMKLEVADKGLVDIKGIADVTFNTDSHTYRWRVLVAPIEEDGLRGMDFLFAQNFELSRKGLKLDGQRVKTITEGLNLEHVKVCVTKDTVIPANSQVVVSAKVSAACLKHQVALLEPISQREMKGGLIVSSCLVNPSGKEANIPVSVSNVTMENITLHQNTSVGKLSEVDSVKVLLDNDSSESKSGHKARNIRKNTSYNVSSLRDWRGMPVPDIDKWPESLQDLYHRSSVSLSAHESEQLAKLIEFHRGAFASSATDLGQTAVVTHTIDTGDAKPIKQQPRRTPRAFEGEEEKIIQDQLQAGIIQESMSPWSSPLVYVRKKDGSTRPCVDFRRLNEVTEKMAYPLPLTSSCLDSLNGARYMSSLDLQSGYWQIKVDEKDRPKTAFTSKHGLYEYLVMPFGLTNAPGTFQRCMEIIFRGLQWKSLVIFLDDIILFNDTFEQHLGNLNEVLERLTKAGLKLKPSKCNLIRNEILFLGHVVSETGIKVDPEKIRAVVDWPVPQNVHDVRVFIGFCSYYRRFVRGFSSIVSPLTHLLEAEVKFEWTDECRDAFKKLKEILTSQSVMAYPKDSGLLILDTDASGTGIGATLSQLQLCEKTGKEEERPIAHASKSMNKAQRQYCVTRKELLAVVYFVQHFRHYLLGRDFVIRTDHSALRWVMSFKDPRDQMARWLEVLSQYRFKIVHRDGKKHRNADSLSRVPCDPTECSCYDGQTLLSDLPCGGCNVCIKRHEQWSSFQEVDDVVPLMTRNVRVSQPENPVNWKWKIVVNHRLFLSVILCLTVLLSWVLPLYGYLKGFACRISNKLGGESYRVRSATVGLSDSQSNQNNLEDKGNSDSAEEAESGVTWLGQYTKSDLKKLQSEDPDLGPVLIWLNSDSGKPGREIVAAESPSVRNLWLQWEQLTLVNGVLYRKWHSLKKKIPPCLQLVVPKSLQDTILKSMHCDHTGAHLGVKKTASKIKQKFYWYRLKESVRTWVRNCTVCGARKSPGKRPKAALQKYQVGFPMDRVATDILGPFPESTAGNKYILVVGDYFTRWIEAYAIPDFSAKTVAEKLVFEFFSRFGVPLDLHSDQGRNYESTLFKELCKLLDVNKTRSSAYHPESNGMCERFNRTLLDMIAVYTSENQTDWDVYLHMLTAAYRSCTHETTGYTPNLLMLGREVHLPIEVALGARADPQPYQGESQYVAQLQDKLLGIYQLVRNSCKMQLPKKDNDSRIASKTYKVGDLVYYHDITRTVGKSPKLKSDIWKGPFVVVKKFSDILFEIKAHTLGKSKILHFNRLKPYISDSIPEIVQKLRKNITQNEGGEVRVSNKKNTHSKRKKQVHISNDTKASKPSDTSTRRSNRQRKVPERLGL